MTETSQTDRAHVALMKRIALAGPISRGDVREALFAGLGGSAAIGFLAACSWATTPLIIAPFGASCVLLFTVPSSPLAQPRNVILGHIISALIGLAVLFTLGQSPIAIAIAVGLAIAAMRVTRTTHPPAGANPIVILLAGSPWWFFAVPVATGAAILVLFAWVYHRFVTGLSYPAR